MDAKELLEKYKSGNCTPAEKAIVETWYLKFEQQKPQALSDTELEDAADRIWKKLPIHQETSIKRKLWPQIGVAAAILLTVSIGLYFFKGTGFNRQPHSPAHIAQRETPQILPGGNKATLTLADGKKITLDEAVNGPLAEEAGIIITKTKDGQLVYTVSARNNKLADGQAAMNLISTPKGGQYQVNLPDGTKVWLNAASSLRYPAVFTGAERSVILTGEAYFEVAKDPVKPFKVSAALQTVEVLGTHFNINSYQDEPAVKTTLLEGAVKVNAQSAGDVFLKPGQQAVLLGNHLNVNLASTEEAVAWKNGMFRFKDADLQTVMRSVARWYDVEVNYEGNLPVRQFSGEIHRNINLSEVLDILSFFKVHFRIEGKKITVTK
ncbi:ferric-dicitrate binding protein FerR (iron transport regulator) [Pedobacter cryoconitis]|uniref:Ferric-dicitrate binding protein FerR (Iron transport regulator) n=1 Tax=Pedobacter cryoconitis TaxID=188932 RepID=A0A7W8ZNT9_9SPHI|nr:FecR family protein [Pedobacter cryoconitis]MBB5637437.1 ferric-dicitrate binding protein FerR (iron transport regulator) [Pedobacter cryoconitis]